MGKMIICKKREKRKKGTGSGADNPFDDERSECIKVGKKSNGSIPHFLTKDLSTAVFLLSCITIFKHHNFYGGEFSCSM